MLNLLTIKSLGDFDVNYDLEPCDLPPEVFTSGSNFILRNGKISSFNGSRLISTLPPSFNAGQIQRVQSGTQDFYLVLGLNKAYTFDGVNWFDITNTVPPVMASGDQYLWTTCLLGNIPIVNNPQDYPAYWSPQSGAQELQFLNYRPTQTFKDVGIQAKVIRSHKNFLFALNIIDNGVEYPNKYMWSHPADNNGLPFTWDPLDLSAIAGDADILGDGGTIIDGRSLRDSFCIYTQRGITLLDYIGGEFIWQARELSSSSGLLTTNCVADIYGTHIFLSDSDILLNDGNSIRSVANRKVRTKIDGLISAASFDMAYTAINPSKKEVWFCIPTEGAQFPNIALIYNWVDDKISIRNINRSFSGSSYGPVLFAPVNWGNINNSWDTYPEAWLYSSESPFSQEIVAINAEDSGIYTLETPDNTISLNTSLERLGVVFGDQRNVTTIIRCYPHIQSAGNVIIQFGSQDFVGGPTRWAAPVTFTPNSQRKVDIRTTGKLHSWRIQSVGNVPFSLSGMDIEFTQNGVR